jgi:hypothetical protein
MTDSDNTEDKTPSQTEQTTEAATPPEPITDLSAEVAGAAAGSSDPYNFNSLDDIHDPLLKKAVQSYTSRAVNAAKDKWQEKAPAAPATQQPSPESSGYMTQEQVEKMLHQRDAEHRLRYEATNRLREVFNKAGIQPDSDQHKQVVSYYETEKAAGHLAPEVLLSEAGVNSLIHASGALLPNAAGPGSASARIPGHVENHVVSNDEHGSIQLGKANETEEDKSSPSAIAREKMRKIMDSSSF